MKTKNSALNDESYFWRNLAISEVFFLSVLLGCLLIFALPYAPIHFFNHSYYRQYN